jgi:hypothetical protein
MSTALFDTDPNNFKAWYVDVLESLYPIRSAGIAAFMITLPLAERYLRQKAKVGPTSHLTDQCMKEFVGIIPSLNNVKTAQAFWTVYRHGFLHQGTLSVRNRSGVALPTGWLTHDQSDPFAIRSDGGFVVQPVLFSKAVIGRILADFNTFSGVAGGAPPLPKVARLDPITIPSTYIGTRGG